MSQLLDPILHPLDDDDDNDVPTTTTRRVTDTDPEEPDRMSSSSASVAAITSASAVTSLTPSTSAVSSTVRSQNPATPQSSTAKSTILSSAAAASSTSTSSSTTSTRPTLTSTSTSSSTSSARPTSTSSLISSSSTKATLSSGSASKSASSATSSATKAASENGKSGIGGSGLSLGALVGIIIGGIVALVLIGIVATRTIRQKQRRDRAKRRSSMFEWPSTTMDDEPYEKPRYEPPSQSYAMSDSYGSSNNANGNGGSVSYVTNETSYAPLPTQQQVPQNYMERNNPQYSYNQQPSYPPQQPQYQENIVPPPMVAPAHASMQSNSTGGGLRDGSMVRVNVGFVRSLEDELAITPGQQLYLHQMYDDGWCLCEDSNQFKGVVPISCLQPLSSGGGGVVNGGLAPDMARQGSGGSGGSAERLQRRSSLYREH
ncbi:hypothetical protein V866_006990 [Kwoniella sp. B9012]